MQQLAGYLLKTSQSLTSLLNSCSVACRLEVLCKLLSLSVIESHVSGADKLQLDMEYVSVLLWPQKYKIAPQLLSGMGNLGANRDGNPEIKMESEPMYAHREREAPEVTAGSACLPGSSPECPMGI